MPGGAPTWSPAWPRCTPPRSRTSARSPISDMAMKLQAARLLTYWAAARADAGRRADLESGLAKVYASEVAYECAFADIGHGDEAAGRQAAHLLGRRAR